MKSKLIYLLIFITFTSIVLPSVSNLVKAQTNPAGEVLNVIPGITCGVPGSDTNKCCSYPNDPLKASINFGVPAIDAPLNVITSPITFIINKISNGVFYGVKKAFPMPACIREAKSSTEDPSAQNCICVSASSSALLSLEYLCNNINTKEQASCKGCINGGGVWTGVGCIQANVNSFIQQTLLTWGIGLAGIIALLCIIYSSFMMQTSRGNPEKIKKAQELLTSCIMGLILIIFSVFILRLIGVSILKIPGFG